MVDGDFIRKSQMDAQGSLSHAPRASDALKKGISVSVTTWGGREIAVLVCDREQSGLLLDAR